MSASWTIYLDDPLGNRLALLDNAVRFSVSKVINRPGVFELVLPGNFDKNLLLVDGIVEFWRQPEGGKQSLFNAYLIQRISQYDLETSAYIELGGWDGLELLERRIVAYKAGSSEAEKTDYADDMIKAVVDENLGGSATDSARDLSDYISIAGDLSAGVSITKSFSYRNALTVCQEIAAASATGGTDIYFDMVPTLDGTTLFDFRTYTGQPGANHTQDENNPAFFGVNWGNLLQPILTYDYSEDQNAIYAGGLGTEDKRYVYEAESATRQGRSIWGRREGFIFATEQKTEAGVQAKANATLYQRRAAVRFSGTLLDTPQAAYGVDWQWGDRITAEYRGETYDCLVRAVRISINEGQELIEARMEYETGV